jgi:glyoxylate reductase
LSLPHEKNITQNSRPNIPILFSSLTYYVLVFDMSTNEKILCLLPIPEPFFRERFSNWIDLSKVELQILNPDALEDDICKAATNATIIYAGPGRPPITRKIIESAPQLKLIQMPGAGYDEVDIAAANDFKIPVATARGGNARAVAEHAIMFMLVLLKHGISAHEGTIRGEWPQFDLVLRKGTWELGGKTLGILGLGKIGREVAKMVKGFGVHMIYHNRNRLDEVEERELEVEYVGFDGLLSRSDIISVHVPLAEETRGMIGSEEIRMMKNGAVIVNLSRGGVVDEGAVVEAIGSGKLLGAGFDVFESEPLLTGDLFLEVDNVILSPHLAGATTEAIYRLHEIAGRNFASVMEGIRPVNIVNDV